MRAELLMLAPTPRVGVFHPDPGRKTVLIVCAPQQYCFRYNTVLHRIKNTHKWREGRRSKAHLTTLQSSQVTAT